MIIVVDALNRHLFGDVLNDMFALRARVFSGRLGWDVSVEDGMEKDQFDDICPAYLISLDDDGKVVGALRLLHTTGPHMLSDVFVDIMDGEPPLRSVRLWECTRFCVDTEKLKGKSGRNTISYVTSELFIGATEYGKNAGILDAITVIDPVMNRVMIRSGNAPYDYVGKTVQMGKVKAMAGLMDCSAERIATLREYSGITHDVFATDEQARARYNQNKEDAPSFSKLMEFETPPPSVLDLQNYCNEQISAATTDTERTAAYALQLELDDLLRGANRTRCDA